MSNNAPIDSKISILCCFPRKCFFEKERVLQACFLAWITAAHVSTKDCITQCKFHCTTSKDSTCPWRTTIHPSVTYFGFHQRNPWDPRERAANLAPMPWIGKNSWKWGRSPTLLLSLRFMKTWLPLRVKRLRWITRCHHIERRYQDTANVASWCLKTDHRVLDGEDRSLLIRRRQPNETSKTSMMMESISMAMDREACVLTQSLHPLLQIPIVSKRHSYLKWSSSRHLRRTKEM